MLESYSGFASAPHTIVITVLGKKDTASKAVNVVVDSLIADATTGDMSARKPERLLVGHVTADTDPYVILDAIAAFLASLPPR